MDRLPLEMQTLYAELLERLSAIETRRSTGDAPGSFVAKEIKGETYCYFQYSTPGGGRRQVYIGRRDAVLDRVVQRYRADRLRASDERAAVERIGSLLRAGGALVTDAGSARVIRALADAGVFHLGGVLVGTHAFVVLGNILGVRWAGGSQMTQDIDIAAETAINIVIPEIRADVPDVLEGLEMGFLPVPSLDPRSPSTSFKVRGKGLRVDLLTPLRGRRTSGVTPVPRFNAAAQPLPFLDFLIARPVRAAVVAGTSVMVNVPDPARFALHKLIVAGLRGTAMHAKREKDLRQAGQVLSLLIEERPGDLRIACNDLRKRGSGWVRRVRSGRAALQVLEADTARQLAAFLGDL